MPELTTDIRYIKGIGEKRAEALGRLGIRTLGDLLCYFPRDYEDRTAVRPIAELLPDEKDAVSHRGKALQMLADLIQTQK